MFSRRFPLSCHLRVKFEQLFEAFGVVLEAAADAAGGQPADSVDQMAKAAAKLVELPDHQRVPGDQSGEACIQPPSAIPGTRDAVLIYPLGISACGDERIGLQIMDLTAIGLSYAGVSDHGDIFGH